MRSSRTVALAFVAILAVVCPAFAADVQVVIHDGRVTIVATNATVGEILTEWAKVGQVKVENIAGAPREPVTIQLRDVSEQQALATVLRRAGGYVAERRASAGATVSGFERILVMAVSVPARPVKAPAASEAASASQEVDLAQADGEQQLSSMAQARAEQIAAARGQSVVDDPTDQGTTSNQVAAGQGPARDTSALRTASDAQPVAPLPVDVDVPVKPGTVDDIPPQDPRAQEAFRLRRALETVDPRTITLPKSLLAPPKQPGGR